MPNQQNFNNERYTLLARIQEMYTIDPRVLEAVQSIPRHHFVPMELQSEAYDDTSLPIGLGQTISQPSLVAYMTNCLKLKGDETVLEVGTGSGYQAAILAKLAKQVISIERIPELSAKAQKRLEIEGITNVKVIVGDGTVGVSEYAPYDAIITTAAFENIPHPLLEQLKDGGILVMPVGGRWNQNLVRVKKEKGELLEERLMDVQFVSLIGEHGYKDSASN